MIEINMNLVYTIINVIILYLLLRHFLIKPVTDIMEKRKQLIADGLQSAQDAQDGALKMKQEYEAALNGAKQESVQIVENARKSAKAEYDRILEEAGNKADSMIASAKETIRIEREKTIHELKGEITGLAIASAAFPVAIPIPTPAPIPVNTATAAPIAIIASMFFVLL